MSTHTTTTTVPQVLLPGQAAAPSGPVDVHMMYVLHHAFRRDLALFRAAAPLTPLSDRVAWEALRTRWQLFREALHHHHGGEDRVLWPMLAERATPAERDLLDTMEAEHSLIDPLLEACDAGFEAVLSGREGRQVLADDLAATERTLLAHLAHEEADAMALVQRTFTQEDWAAMVAEAFEGDTSPKDAVRGAAWILDGLPEDVRARIPAPLRVFARLTRGRFRRLDARTRWYLP